MTTKRGRPSRSKTPADNRLTIRLTDDELARLQRAAGDQPISDWLRDVALEAAASKSAR